MLLGFGRVFIGVRRYFSTKENSYFWIGQIAVVFSTIFGVYLATSEGLKSAIEFHSVTKLERKYYTLSALYKEIKENNDLVKAFSKKNNVLDDAGEISAFHSYLTPELNWFVWNMISDSQESLELPVELLRDASNYQIDIESNIKTYQKQRGYDKLRAAQKIVDLTMETDQQLLNQIKTKLDDYKSTLKAYKGVGDY